MNLVNCPNCEHAINVPMGWTRRTEHVTCPECNCEFQAKWKVQHILSKWFYAFGAVVFFGAIIAYLIIGEAKVHCLPLAHEAAELHGEMREVFAAYQGLKTSADAEEHSSEVLQAADHTLELMTETLNKWTEVLICSDVLEYDWEEK